MKFGIDRLLADPALRAPLAGTASDLLTKSFNELDTPAEALDLLVRAIAAEPGAQVRVELDAERALEVRRGPLALVRAAQVLGEPAVGPLPEDAAADGVADAGGEDGHESGPEEPAGVWCDTFCLC